MLDEGWALSELLLHFAIPFGAFSYFRRPREASAASLAYGATVVFGYVATATDSLMAPITAHGLGNMFLYLIPYARCSVLPC